MENKNEQSTCTTFANGSKEWRLNGQRHREDGPAIEWANGTKEWWVNDQRHRLDGPAREWADGSKEWWINGNELSESKFKQRTKQRIKEPNQANEKPLSFFDSLIL